MLAIVLSWQPPQIIARLSTFVTGLQQCFDPPATALKVLPLGFVNFSEVLPKKSRRARGKRVDEHKWWTKHKYPANRNGRQTEIAAK